MWKRANCFTVKFGGDDRATTFETMPSLRSVIVSKVVYLNLKCVTYVLAQLLPMLLLTMLVSLQGNKKVYFDKSDYIELCDSLKAEYYIGFFLIIGVGYLFFIILCASVPFFSVRRIIIQNKKRKIKRAKREAYRKKHSETEDSPASSNKKTN